MVIPRASITGIGAKYLEILINEHNVFSSVQAFAYI
jgi:hypothetical protein